MGSPEVDLRYPSEPIAGTFLDRVFTNDELSDILEAPFDNSLFQADAVTKHRLFGLEITRRRVLDFLGSEYLTRDWFEQTEVQIGRTALRLLCEVPGLQTADNVRTVAEMDFPGLSGLGFNDPWGPARLGSLSRAHIPDILTNPFWRSTPIKVKHWLTMLLDTSLEGMVGYRHPLGFIKLRLAHDEKYGEVRVHDFPALFSADNDVHPHWYDMLQTTLMGNTSIYQWALEDSVNLDVDIDHAYDPSDFPWYEYELSRKASGDSWEYTASHTGFARLALPLRANFRRDDEYFVHSKGLHQVVTGANEVITTAEFRYHPDYPQNEPHTIYTKEPKSKSIPQEPVEEEQLRALIGAVVKTLRV